MVNPNQARPLVAFWLLAIAAAIISGLGLLHDGPRADGPSGPPARETAGTATELVRG